MSDKDTRDRQEFEKWSRKEGYFIEKDPQGIYISFTMQRWHGYQAALVYAREAEQPAGGDELQRLNDAHKEYADARIDAHNAFYLLSNKYGYRFRLDKALDAYELTRQKQNSEAERKPGEDVNGLSSDSAAKVLRLMERAYDCGFQEGHDGNMHDWDKTKAALEGK